MSQETQQDRRPAQGGVSKFTTVVLFAALALAAAVVVTVAVVLAGNDGKGPATEPGHMSRTVSPQQP